MLVDRPARRARRPLRAEQRRAARAGRPRHERVRELEARAAELRELAGARERELDLLASSSTRSRRRRRARRSRRAALRARAPAPPGGAASAAAASAPRRSSPTAGAARRELLARGDAATASAAAALDPALRRSCRAPEASATRPRTRRRAAPLLRAGTRRGAPGERSRRSRSVSRCSPGSSASTGARSPTCSRTPSAAGAGATSSTSAEVALEDAEAELARPPRSSTRSPGELGAPTPGGRRELARAVRERLAELAMAEARFEVRVAPREDGCGPRGAETVELHDRAQAGRAHRRRCARSPPAASSRG